MLAMMLRDVRERVMFSSEVSPPRVPPGKDRCWLVSCHWGAGTVSVLSPQWQANKKVECDMMIVDV